MANFAWRKTCFGCERPKQTAMHPPPETHIGSQKTRSRNRRRGKPSGDSDASCEGRNGEGSAAAARAAPAVAQVQGNGAQETPLAGSPPPAEARSVAHLGLPLPKVGDLEKRFPKPTMPFAPAKSPGAFVAAATSAASSDRLTTISSEIDKLVQLIAMLEELADSKDLPAARDKLGKYTAERSKRQSGPVRGTGATAHRMEQAKSKAAGDAADRI